MTARGLLAVCLRRWVVVVLGVSVSVALVGLLAKPERVYWTRVTATVVTAPSDSASPTGGEGPSLLNQPAEALSMATLLAVRVNGGINQRRSASPDATLYGEGYRQAVSARVRNTGGQWTSSVSDPVIDVEVVDLTPERVRTTMIAQTDMLAAELGQLQEDLRVPQAQRMILDLSPTAPRVEVITSSQTRAWFAASAFGLGVTLSFTYFLDRALTRRRSRKAPS